MKAAKKALNAAEALAESTETWADLSNALFDATHGVITQAFPDRETRKQFMQTAEYRRIQALLNAKIEETGLVEGATPVQKSGRFVVRLPQSLHAALEQEARKEGVSLNQLVVAKLSAQLSTLVGQ